jgi:hypothetical protein
VSTASSGEDGEQDYGQKRQPVHSSLLFRTLATAFSLGLYLRRRNWRPRAPNSSRCSWERRRSQEGEPSRNSLSRPSRPGPLSGLC